MRGNFVPIGCPEMVRNYHCWLCNNPEERSSHLLRDASLKTHSFGFNQTTTDMLQWRTCTPACIYKWQEKFFWDRSDRQI